MTTGDSVIPCPGCGGRNPPGSIACEWCARPFVTPPRRFDVRWWQVATTVAVLLAAGALLVLGFLNTTREPARSRSPAPSATAAPVATSLPAPVGASPPGATGPTPEPSPTVAATPTPPVPAFVRVANTGGAGVYLRREPGANGARIVAWPERTVLEVVGAEQEVEGKIWLPVQDPRGNRGWVQRDYVEEAEPEPSVPRP